MVWAVYSWIAGLAFTVAGRALRLPGRLRGPASRGVARSLTSAVRALLTQPTTDVPVGLGGCDRLNGP